MFYLLSVFSSNPITLEEKKNYIRTLYPDSVTYTKEKKRNQGFIRKFNNSIGFKNVVDEVDNTSTVLKAKVESPESYLSPDELIHRYKTTPVSGNVVFNFYIPDTKMSHLKSQYCYKGKNIAIMFEKFINKIFPDLQTELSKVEEKPKQELVEFAREYFYLCLERDVTYTIEFSAPRFLEKEEMTSILETLNPLSNYCLGIAQYQCNACSGYSDGERPYHIELVYLSKEKPELATRKREEYGERLFTLS